MDKNKKLDFVVSEINNIINNDNSSTIESNFNQDTEWLIVKKNSMEKIIYIMK